jgi:folylpolyglutamate synthase/dihydropteroate synthase
VESLVEISPFTDPGDNAILFGCLMDKPAEQILDRLSTLAKTLVVVNISSDRARPARELLRAATGRFPVRVQAATVAEGLGLARGATAPSGFTLVTGSDYLVGEVIRTLEGADGEEPDLSDPVLLREPDRSAGAGGT